MGNAAQALGQYREAIDYYEQSLQIYREIGDRKGEACSLNNLGNAAKALSQYRAAIAYTRSSATDQ
jgi:tetratricopeptide (TPR) repeat protein